MKFELPSAEEYASERAKFAALEVVDLYTEQCAVLDAYKNQVMLDIKSDCMRMSVFEGEYRWHIHPDSDELFLVVDGELHIELKGGAEAVLCKWRCMVIPAGTAHRTRAVGRTVNLTFEKQGAKTVFIDPPLYGAPDQELLSGTT